MLRAPRGWAGELHTSLGRILLLATATGPCVTDSPDARDLVDATLLFLQRGEEALASGVPGRALDACNELHIGICSTLAQQAGAVHNAVGGRSAREHEALDVLRKRMAETEGALLHLRLTLQRGSADGPALGPYMRRMYVETITAIRCLDALRACFLLWAEAAAPGAGAVPREGSNRRAVPTARDCLRAAREALAADVPQASAPLLREAMRRAGARDPEVERELSHAGEDAVRAWRTLDRVESAVNSAGASLS